MKLRKDYKDIDNELIREIEREFNLPHSLANYLFHLGYDNREKVCNYLNPNIGSFYDPFLFPDMKKIVDRINLAIKGKERILIFGDYDADGIGSTAILYKYFESLGVCVDYFLPSRYSDGYGLTIDSINKVIELYNPNLIITVDCGITCIKEVDYVKSLGIDIIITDHHEPLETLPNSPTIDCKIKNQPYPFRFLCGAGMALKLVYALSDYETARRYFTICAISTIADIVELTDENRFIVVEGLKSYERDCPNGLKYLFKKLKIKDAPTSTDVSYKIAPKINATGRMGDATISLKLYLENDNAKIIDLYKQIIEMNEKRQVICQDILEEAQKIINANNMQNDSILVLKNDKWETGVLGIVCAKLIECYNKSIILLGKDARTGNYVGSARAVEGVNIYEALSSLSDYLVTFGGHEMAAGLTISESHFNDFREQINLFISTHTQEVDRDLLYDIECGEDMLNLQYLEALNRFEPFGVANPKPRFMLRTKNLFTYPMNKHNEHLLVKFNNYSGVMFSKPHYIYTLNSKAVKGIFYSPNIEEYANKKNIKLFVDGVFCDDISDFSKDISNGSYFKQYIYAISAENNLNMSLISVEEMSNLPHNGVVYVSHYSEISNTIKDALNYDIVDLVYISHKKSDNTLLIAPYNFDDLNAFNTIVLLDNVLDPNYINYLQFKYPKASIKIVNNLPKKEVKVTTDKQTFIRFYAILLTVKDRYFDEINMYKNCFYRQNFDYAQFVFCLYVFEELGIVKIFRDNDFYVEIDNKKKTNLYNSRLYCKMLAK